MAPNGRYHASDFSLKNKRPPENIIFIDTLRAARVFIAFTFPQPCECAILQTESYRPILAGKDGGSWGYSSASNFVILRAADII